MPRVKRVKLPMAVFVEKWPRQFFNTRAVLCYLFLRDNGLLTGREANNVRNRLLGWTIKQSRKSKAKT